MIQECKRLFDKAYTPKWDDYSGAGAHNKLFVKKFNVESATGKLTVSVPNDLWPLVKGTRIVLHARIKHLGVIYARSSAHLGNSLIYFYPGGNTSSLPTPGSVKYIYNSLNGIAFTVQRHYDMLSGTVDPFAFYPNFPAKLYSSILSVKLEVV